MSSDPNTLALTRADAVALWHAVQNSGYMVRAMDDSNSRPAEREQENTRHAAARKALRKVQAIVRAAKSAKAGGA